MAAYMSRSSFSILLLLFSNYLCIQGLYEDEIGKFDWRQRHVGKITFVQFEQSGKKNVFVATESNVLAALNARTGEINWRQVFQRGPGGNFNALHYKDDDLISVSGGGRKVHSWSSSNGFLKWESSTHIELDSIQSFAVSTLCSHDDGNLLVLLVANTLQAITTATGKEKWSAELNTADNVQYKWIYEMNDEIMVLGLVDNSHFTVQLYNLDEGELTTQNLLPAAWATSLGSICTVIGEGHMVCFDPISMELHNTRMKDGSVFQSTLLSTWISPTTIDGDHLHLRGVAPGSSTFILKLTSDRHLLLTLEGSIQLIQDISKATAVGTSILSDHMVITTVTKTTESEVEIRCFNAANGEEHEHMWQSVDIENNHGIPVTVSVYLFLKKDQQLGYRMLLETADNAVTMVHQPSRVLWCREEGLANVAAVELVDLPVSDTDAKFEDEFGGKEQISVLEMFVRRLSTQFAQLKSYMIHLSKRLKYGSHRVESSSRTATRVEDDEEEYLTRDAFNLHKMLVIVSKSGKIYGIDSTDGSIFWSHYSPNLGVFEDRSKSRVEFFIQRTTAHFPNPPQCMVVGKHKVSGLTVVYSFNPITGKATTEFENFPHGKELNFKLKQLTMINIMDQDFLKPILLLDDQNQIHVQPPSAASVVKEHASSIFMFVAERDAVSIVGLRLVVSGDQLQGEQIWRVKLSPTSQRITGIYVKRSTEEVHSQGRVLGDRTVLYKYLNPNLVVVTTEGSDDPAKSRLSIYLLDVVNGAIIFSMDHKRVSGPIHVIHSENWITYQYWNSKLRRAEITALELYEGKVQKNSTAFSSIDPPESPLVERQSYILPSLLQAMAVSHTEKGITHKNIIMSLQAGGLIVLPKRLLDPRRPIEPLPEHREEGLIPYLPELPLHYQSFINYNQSVFGIDGIYTAPAGLESTCLVLAYGLDYYYTHISPSKLFDVLNEDFDYLLIATVVVGLVVAAVITKKLAAIKALNQAWR